MRVAPWGAHALRENSKKEKGKIRGGGRARAKIIDFGKVPKNHKIGKKIDRVVAFEEGKVGWFFKPAGGTGRRRDASTAATHQHSNSSTAAVITAN